MSGTATATSFYRGENPLRADKLNTALSERVSRMGDAMAGVLTLWRDPQAPSEAATKQYVDTKVSTIVVPPAAPSGVVSFNARSGVVVQISADITGALGYTPYDSANPAGYITAAQAVSAAPVQSFNTRTGAIVLTSADVTTALTYTPYNATNPSGYQTAAQVTAALGPYALSSSVPVASSTTPLMDGTATIGVTTTWARADHIHPTDTSRYAASNPAGYQTAAQVTAVLPVASAVLPLIEGTAAVGTSAAYARADHVHPAVGGASVIISDTPPV